MSIATTSDKDGGKQLVICWLPFLWVDGYFHGSNPVKWHTVCGITGILMKLIFITGGQLTYKAYIDFAFANGKKCNPDEGSQPVWTDASSERY